MGHDETAMYPQMHWYGPTIYPKPINPYHQDMTDPYQPGFVPQNCQMYGGNFGFPNHTNVHYHHKGFTGVPYLVPQDYRGFQQRPPMFSLNQHNRRDNQPGFKRRSQKMYTSHDCQPMHDSDLSPSPTESLDSANGTISTTSSENHNATSTPSKTSKLRRRTRNRNSQSHSFHNQYDLLEKADSILGQGAYATVRLAIRKKDKKKFAVKVIDKNNKANTREKCFNEMRQLQRCKGAENILNMLEFYEDIEKYYIVTEYMAGGNLHDRLEEGVPLTQYEAASITRDLARALAFLHAKRISHRDIKPQNILCKNATTLSPVVLSDFDLSCADDENSNASYDFDQCSHTPRSPFGDSNGSENQQHYETRDFFIMEMDSPVGSPEYMSPEIAQRFLIEDEMLCDKYTEATDIWSLGVLLYKALSGDVPFKAVGCRNPECQWEEGQACADCQVSLWEEICQADLQFKSKIWASICPQAKHLVTRCLTLEAEDRITAAQILEHPFIRALADLGTDQEIGSLSRTIDHHLNVAAEPDGMQGIYPTTCLQPNTGRDDEGFEAFIRLLRLDGRLQLSEEELIKLDKIENPEPKIQDSKLAEDLFDHDSGHGSH